MATRHEFLQGKGYFCFLDKLDKFGNWSIGRFYPTAESLEKLRNMKLKNRFNEDELGTWITLRRQPTKRWRDGTVQTYAKPEVVNREGQPFTGIIGNGSDLTVDLEVYTYGEAGSFNHGAGSRIHRVCIDNLVEYVAKKTYEPGQEGDSPEEIPF